MAQGKGKVLLFACYLLKWLKVLFSTLNFRLSENGKHDFKLSAEWMSISRYEQLFDYFQSIIGSQEGSFLKEAESCCKKIIK